VHYFEEKNTHANISQHLKRNATLASPVDPSITCINEYNVIGTGSEIQVLFSES
jgi:hypothetical protein